MYPIGYTLAVVSLKPTVHPLKTLSFKEDYRDKICGKHKNVRVSEVVIVVCQVWGQVQAHTYKMCTVHAWQGSKSVTA